MSIYYVQEHLSCNSCEVRRNGRIIDILKVQHEGVSANFVSNNTIIFVRDGGGCEIFTDDVSSLKLKSNTAFFLPLGSYYRLSTDTPTEICIIRFNPLVKLCEKFSLEKLLDEDVEFDRRTSYLEVNQPLNNYLDALTTYVEDGLRCVHLMSMKAKELLYVLRAYYTKEQLANFFQPILNRDHEFAEFVYKNWEKVRNVKEFAELSRYSENSFSKKFKQTFNTSPYKWLNEKRAGRIFYEVCCTTKAFKEISDEYNFTSVQQFTTFCKKNLCDTPGTIRKGKDKA